MPGQKLQFGTSAKEQIALRLRSYISREFKSDAAAARSLRIDRRKLSSYTTAKSFPGDDVIDVILREWGLDLLSGAPRKKRSPANQNEARSAQLEMFEKPVIFRNADMTVTIERKGARVGVKIELVAEAKIA